MKSKNLFWGIFFVFIGLFWFLNNLGFINFSVWFSLLKLWPLIFIVIGINIILGEKKYVKTVVWLLFFLIVILYGVFEEKLFEGADALESSNIVLEKKSETENGTLVFNVGIGKFQLEKSSEKLLEGYISDTDVRNKVIYSEDNKNVNLVFENSKPSFFTFGNKDNYHLMPNKDIVWDLKADVGIIQGCMDLSNLHISQLEIDSGISNVEVIFSDVSTYTEVKLDSGISNYQLTIPKTVGVKIDLDTGLVGTNLKELGWSHLENDYISPNYDDSPHKLFIDADIGIGSLDVTIE